MKKYSVLIIVAICTSFSCSSVRYVSDHLENQEGPYISTYNVEGHCEDGISQIYEIRVANALHQAMRAHGYKESDRPQYLLKFLVKEQQESYLATECDFYGRWIYGQRCSTNVVNYSEGTIVVDVVNTDTQTIIWHGAVYGPSFDNLSDPGPKIKSYINRLMEDYFFKGKSPEILTSAF